MPHDSQWFGNEELRLKNEIDNTIIIFYQISATYETGMDCGK